jgi:hypothetical protein
MTAYPGLRILHNLAVLQFNDLIAEMKIPVVVSNDDH